MAVVKFTLDDKAGEIDLDKLMFSEGRAIEKVCGEPLGEWSKKLQQGSVLAIQALAWIALKRTNPGISFSDLDEIAINDVVVDFGQTPNDEETVDDGNPLSDGTTGPADANQ
jgi:hypothetical protein